MSSASQSFSPTQGAVKEILLSDQEGGAMFSMKEARAVAGQGLVGDRNFSLVPGTAPKKNLTLIESEKIAAFSKAYDLPFSAADSRRNIVTTGIELNPLLGHEFFVGPVKLRALELCEPCSLLARRTHRAVLHGLVHQGGLRCEILSGGTIQVGDPVRLSA